MRKYIFTGAICLLVILAIILSVGKPTSASPLEKKLYEAAKKEGVLEYWDSLSLKDVSELWKGFESKYPGIKLKYFEATTDVRDEKYLAEHNAGRHTCDVISGDQYFAFKKAGLLKDLSDLVKDTGYPKKYCTKDLDGVSLEHLLIGTAYNTKLVSPQDVPRTWEDLLDPKWKGKINVENRMKYFIYSTGYWGEEKLVDYLKKLGKQNPSFTKGVTYTTALLAAGEYPISVGMYFHRTLIMQKRGAPIAWAGLGPIVDKLTPFYSLRYAPHPNAARLFLHWWMSPEGSAFVDSKRHKSNPEPGSGTQTSKILEKAGSPDIYVMPTWEEVDQNVLFEKYQKAVGYSKERLKAKKKKK